METVKSVLGIFAHPDDAEFLCAGTLTLLSRCGFRVHIATMAQGDKGTAVHSKEEIIKIRKAEARKAALMLEGEYHCLDFEDLYIFYERGPIDKATSLIRRIKPLIVFTGSPDDYMRDHEITSQIVQSACFSAGIINMEIPENPFEPIPYLYYCDPMEGKDKLGKGIKPSFYVDISDTIEMKTEMLKCHESQRNWLLTHHKVDEYILMMKRFAEIRGKEAGVNYAEGFRQHLGHGFLQNNILTDILGDYVKL